MAREKREVASQPRRARRLVYTRAQVALHWLVAGLVLAQYASIGAIVRTHSIRLIRQRRSPTDLVLHALHNQVGLAIVAVMIGRFALRLWVGTPAPGGAAGFLATRLAQGIHLAFYAVLIMEGVTGAIASYFWWPISAVHVILFKILLGLIAIHIAAALWHEFVVRDHTLKRMFRL